MSASQTFACEACGRHYPWKPEFAGRKAKCKCGAALVVPTAPVAVGHAAPAAVGRDGGADAHSSHVGAPAATPARVVGQRLELTEPPAPARAGTAVAAAAGTDAPEAQAAATCPGCQAPLAADAVLCVQCGLDLRTGQKMAARSAASWKQFIPPTWVLIVAASVLVLAVGTIVVMRTGMMEMIFGPADIAMGDNLRFRFDVDVYPGNPADDRQKLAEQFGNTLKSITSADGKPLLVKITMKQDATREIAMNIPGTQTRTVFNARDVLYNMLVTDSAGSVLAQKEGVLKADSFTPARRELSGDNLAIAYQGAVFQRAVTELNRQAQAIAQEMAANRPRQ